MQLPKPFDSRALWGVAMGIGAITGITMTGHATGDAAVAAIVALAGAHVASRSLLDAREQNK